MQGQIPQTTESCASCETALQGAYCHRCGQAALDPDRYRLGSFIGECFSSLTNVERKTLKTLRLLLFRPGSLTREYLAGRHNLYLKPLQLFLIINFIYFIFVTYGLKINAHQTPLRVHITSENFFHQSLAKRMVESRLARENTTLENLETRFDTQAKTLAKTLIFLMIPLFALFLKFLFLGKGQSIVKQAIFATHFYSFYLVAIMAALVLFVLLNALLAVFSETSLDDLFGFDLAISSIVGIIWWVYLHHAFKNLYGLTFWRRLFSSGIAVLGIIGILLTYRMLLFFVVFYTV